MRYLSSSLAGLLLACSDDLVLSVDDDDGDERTFVAIMESQSNGTPHELLSTLTVQSYGDAYPNVQMRMRSAPDTTYQWETYSGDMAAVTFNGGTRIGAYASMLRDLDEALPNGFAVGVRAVGGAFSFDLDSIRADTMSWLATSMTETQCTRLAVVIIHGEADSRGEATANAYDDWLTSVVAGIRAVYPTAIVSFNKLHTDVSPGFYLYKTQLRASQVNFAATLTNGAMVDMDDVPLSGDLAHFTADSLMELGSRLAVPIAAAMGIFIKPVASFGTSTLQRAVTFTDTSIGRGATIVGRVWTPGGAGTWTNGSATTSPATFTYTSDGDYDSFVTVTDSNGRTAISATTEVSVIGGITGVTRDTDSTNYVPANATEMRTFLDDETIGLSAKANASGLQLCQEASGNLADSIGGVGVMTAGSAPAYSQDITGMSRNGVLCADGTAKTFATTAAALPNIATEPILNVAQVQMPSSAPAVNRNLIAVGVGANRAHIGIEATTGKLRVTSGANVAVSASSVCNGAVVIIALRVVPGVGVSGHLGASITVTPTLSGTMSGERLEIGAQSGALTAAAATFAWMAEFFEAWTVPEVQTLLTGLEG